MPIRLPTYEHIQSRALSFIDGRLPGKDTHRNSWFGRITHAMARLLNGFHVSVQAADVDSTPSFRTSTAGLDRLAERRGLDNGAGGFGRSVATKASGGIGTCGGTKGIRFLEGTQLLAPDGVTLIELLEDVTIPGNPPGTDTASGSFAAVTAGTAGNLDAGAKLTWINPPVGATETVTLTAALAGAEDLETDEALLARILDVWQRSLNRGNPLDYRGWAESIDGVFRAYVYPGRDGLGTVSTVITSAGSGTARAPAEAVQAHVDDYVAGSATQQGKAPATVAGYQTLLPRFGAGMSLRVRVVPALASLAFDWDDTAATYTVDTWASGPPATLKLNTVAPASLKAAVDAWTAGAQPEPPRLQILSTGADAINAQVGVTDYDSDPSNTTLTIELDGGALPAGFTAPTAGDVVYAGGQVVEQTAADLLDYVDGLGPSRASNFADPLDNWEDTCGVFNMAQVALDAEDSDGVKLNKNVLAATIDGVATDRQATDSPAAAPELLYALSIAITQ